MSTFKPTFFHVLELVIILAVVYGVQQFFQVSNEAILAVVLVVLSSLAKFARSSDAIPVPDYTRSDK